MSKVSGRLCAVLLLRVYLTGPVAPKQCDAQLSLLDPK